MVKRPPTGTIPDSPGSYQFKDAQGRVIYVGKAASLRQRLSNYFGDPRYMHPRTAQMVQTAETVEWTTVRNEVEALMLEYSLIKQHQPRFNIRLRDDKSYPFLAVTVDEEWPRALVMRGRKRKGTRYFGPYAHAYAIRDTLDELLRSFPIRTCSPAKFRQHERIGRPCLLFHIEKCSGPCVGEIDAEQYTRLVEELCDFLDGDTDPIVKHLDGEMRAAAAALEFEKAARVRDRLAAVRRAIERQQMVAEKSEDLDVIGLAEDELEASVQVFYVRRGRVVGRKGFVVDKVEALTPGGLIDRILESLYGEDPPQGVPKQVLVPTMSEDVETYEEWLEMQRGSKVQIRVPQRGDKRALLETVTRNAQEEFTRHRLRRASDHNTRSRALTELQRYLELPEAPLRIECYDMAHLQGTDYVGSMVVLEDGLPNKREYRRFKVHVPGNDDYAAMEEVLTRRLTAYIAERDRPALERGDKPGRFAYPPQLLVVDGGKGQLGVAERVVRELGLDDEIPVAGLAKRFEEVFVPGRSEPVEIPRGSEALFMLQRIRDEAHRFANTFHGERRSKRMTTSALEGIPGLGETRRKRLVKELGGVNAVKAADLDVLRALPWLPDNVAAAVHAKFHPALAVTDDGAQDLWERYAGWWIDGFTEGADPEYAEQILPLAAAELAGARRVLDIGCGDGQITRLAARGDGVALAVGVDPTWNQIRVARERGGATGFVRAGAGGLPFADGSFDAAVACLVFEHIDDVDAAIAEIARVLAPGGRFCFFLNHPLLQTPGSGWIDDQILDPPEQYWRIGPYLTEAVTLEEVELGVHIRFVHRPLSRYVNALAEQGMLLTQMIEPAPPPGFLALAAEYEDAATVPRLLYLRARKVVPSLT